MTAVVGILNKKAVAIAADSAATTGSGKIFNKANKIFTLSKHHPVGVMIHNLDSFMGVPWETIIKIYRSELGEKELDTVQDYKSDFIGFLHRKNFFCDDQQQNFEVDMFCVGINNYFFNRVDKKIGSYSPDKLDLFKAELKIEAQSHIDFFLKSVVLPEFAGYSYETFETYITPRIDKILLYPFHQHGIIIGKDLKKLLIKAYYQELVVEEYSTRDYTGLIFTGFGKNEIFPSLVPLHIFLAFEKKLRYFEVAQSGAIVTNTNPSHICTFAQSDVMMTILTGIAPELKQSYNSNLKDIFSEQDKILIDKFNGDKVALKELLDKIDKGSLINHFSDIMDEVIRNKYISPLYEAVAGLGKEDLAEMAESLIYLTYLQRRITNAEESVGGAVDVAIISKGDGFVWIKRKHYFPAELNPHFLNKYFK